MKDTKKTKIRKPFNIYVAIVYFFAISLVFGITSTYAWFSSVLTNLNGNLNLGNLAATAYLYESYDDSDPEDEYADGLTNAVVADSTGTNLTTYDMIQKSWYSNMYTSIYLEVQNTGSIDLKSILKLSYDNTSLATFLSYYYYQVVDISQQVNEYSNATNRENIAAYNTAFQSDIEDNLSTYINNITTNGYSITANLATINMGTTYYATSTFYRIDIAVAEMPSQLLTQYNALPVQQREIQLNGTITIKQTNAPDTDEDDSGVSLYISSSDAFINAINGAANGDTIYLTNNIAIPKNITITHRINLYLSGYTLTINGNFGYDIAVAGSITLDVSNSSTLHILGNFIVDTPNATFKILGSGGSAQSIILGNGIDPNLGGFYVNCLLDTNNSQTYGYYQYGVSVMKKVSPTTNTYAPMTVDSNTRISIGLASTTGPIVAAYDASNIEIYNYGLIQSVDFSQMKYLSANNIQIYIYNRNQFTTTPVAITLPTWSLGWKSKEVGHIPSAVNTRIINAPGSISGYSVTGSLVFLDMDIENGDVATSSVVDLGDNYYRVNVQLDNAGHDTNTLGAYLREYYNNLHNNATEAEYEAWLATILGLNFYTYNTAVVKGVDFAYITTYLTNLESIDLTYSGIESSTIPASAFYNKVSLQEIIFPISQLYIGNSAFYGTSLEQVTISSSIASIGADAFNVNTALNGFLKVFYEGENITSLMNNISGLTADKTLLFMSLANVEAFKNNYNITDTWYINSYAEYDFADTNQNYYRIIDGSNVEIVYYGGAWSSLNIPNTVMYDTSSYRVVAISYSAYRRSIIQSGGTAVSVSFPTNIVTVRRDAFYGAAISYLNLNNVTTIGKYAFANTTITTSETRPVGYTGMLVLGDYAFANTVIGTANASTLSAFETNNTTGGQLNHSLDLHGTYTPGSSIFDSAALYGVELNLNNVSSVTAGMTNNMSLYGCELYLNNVTTIDASAFELRFKNSSVLQTYNKVYAQDVKTIGRLAFRGMYLNDFVIGIRSRYITQLDVNANVSYGGTTSGMIYSDFKVNNLLIDGMLPELYLETGTFLFGSATADRTYQNVTIQNTGGVLYDYLFYGTNSTNKVVIGSLTLHDMDSVGDYAFYYTTVSTATFYSGGLMISSAGISSVGAYAFRYSAVPTFGTFFNVSNIGDYAFADTTVPASAISVTGTIGDYAFYNSDTENMSSLSVVGTVGSYVFSQAFLNTVATMTFMGTIDESLFASTNIYDCTSISFEDMDIPANTFNGAVISSTCNIETIGIVNAQSLSFYNLTATNSTLDLTNAITISNDALKNISVMSVRLGNNNFYTNLQSSFIYGTADGGVFGQNVASTMTNLYVDGLLPSERLGTYVLGANGANITITNLYLSTDCGIVPDNMFYSNSVTSRLRITNLYIDAVDLVIGTEAFRAIYVDNIIYNALNEGVISFSGTKAFYLASIGNFENFVYNDSVELVDTGAIQTISDYAFQYATFRQDSNLSWIGYTAQIGNHAFDHATFTQTSLGQNVSFDFTRVPTIGYGIFDSIYSTIGSITLGNATYYQTHLATYYYGNPTGNEGILSSASNLTVESIIIAGNLPDATITGLYQTRILGLSGETALNITSLTIQSAVNKLSSYALSGYSSSYRTILGSITINSSYLSVGESAFAYTDISTMTINSSDMALNKKAFSYSILRNLVYDSTGGLGDISFETNASYVFQYATIYSMTGFVSGSAGAIENIEAFTFYHAIFEMDCDLSWIAYVQNIGNSAFNYTTFTKTSSNAYVDIDCTSAISIGEDIFAYIPIRLGSLTLGNSGYASLYGTSYSYGVGDHGVLYAAGRIDELNIVGNLPTVNTTNMLGNFCEDSNWSVKFGTIVIASAVTSIPANTFSSESCSVAVTIDALTINSTSISIGNSAFYGATIGAVHVGSGTLNIGTYSFKNTTITTFTFSGSTNNFGNSSFANAAITTMSYIGSTSGVLTMTGPSTFVNAYFGAITGFTYTVSYVEHGIVSNISNYAFQGATFAQNCNINWIQHVDSIGTYAFSNTTFTKTSTDNFVNLDLTEVLTIGANAFYHLPINLGTVTIGNDAYSANSFFAYGNGTEGIFNNVGTIQHLIIDGALPTSANALGNKSNNISYLTTYTLVEIESNITTLPENLFASSDTVFSTTIGTLYLYSTSIEIGEGFLYNTVVTNFHIPSATAFNNVGDNAFRNCAITNLFITGTLTLLNDIGSYAFYAFDFNNEVLNVQSVSYIGEYAFSFITYDGSLVFNSAITLIEADYAFSFANISGNLTFNNINSLGSNLFQGLVSGPSEITSPNVTYTFTFSECLEVTSDYAFGNMNGGGRVSLKINGLPSLNSYRAFYNSTNLRTIEFDATLINLNADNIFESASSLTTISFANTVYVTVVNATIVTLPSTVQVYVPGNLLAAYLVDPYWSLVMTQISTNYNLDDTSTWGFYILGETYNASLVHYLGSSTTVTIPQTIIDKNITYTVTTLGADLFTGTVVTTIVIPRSISNVDMDIFSNSDIQNVSFTGSGTAPFYIYTSGGNTTIYESSDMTILYKYLSKNTATTYAIDAGVIQVCERAFYKCTHLITLNYGQTSTQVATDFTLSENAITECAALTTINLKKNSTTFGITLNSYAISSNPALATINLTSYQIILNSYSIYDNEAIDLITTNRSGSSGGIIGRRAYANLTIEPYAFFGSGADSESTCFYTNMYLCYIFGHAYSNSRIRLFEFNVDISSSRYEVYVYNPNAFEVGVDISLNEDGDVVQTYASIQIKVADDELYYYQTAIGFSNYYSSIVSIGYYGTWNHQKI